MAKSSQPAKPSKTTSAVRNSRTTVSGPAEPDASGPGDIAARSRDSEQLLRSCGIDGTLRGGQQDPGLIIASETRAGLDDFVAAIATHRHFARETDPPRV